MDPAETIRSARKRAGLSVAGLAERVGISPILLADYEAGAKIPDPETLDWITTSTSLDRGEELAALLELAEQFPARHSPDLEYPVFGR